MILVAILASSVIGTSAVGVNAHARELLVGIFQDVDAILNSFAGGPDDPNSPVVNQTALNRDAQHLDAATQKAQALASELDNLRSTRKSP